MDFESPPHQILYAYSVWQSIFQELQDQICAADDKRWIMNDGIHTLAHGHYKTKDNLM